MEHKKEKIRYARRIRVACPKQAQLCSLSRYSTLLDMQIIQRVTSHCIMTFEKAPLIQKFFQTIQHE